MIFVTRTDCRFQALLHVEIIFFVIDCLLTPQNLPPDCPKEWWELYFVWATIWAIGGSLFQDQMIDYRIEFSKWFIHEFKTIKFPPQGTVFDYTIEPQSKRFEPWSKLLDELNFDPDLPVQVLFVIYFFSLLNKNLS